MPIGGTGLPTNLLTLRTLRLLRVNHIMRLMRSVRVLVTLVKGTVAAAWAVGLTLVLRSGLQVRPRESLLLVEESLWGGGGLPTLFPTVKCPPGGLL